MSYICWFLLEIPHGSPHGPRPPGCHDRSLRGAELLRLGSAGHDPGFGHLGAHLHGRRGWLGLGKMFFFFFGFLWGKSKESLETWEQKVRSYVLTCRCFR